LYFSFLDSPICNVVLDYFHILCLDEFFFEGELVDEEELGRAISRGFGADSKRRIINK
jgi:hypothetical protein